MSEHDKERLVGWVSGSLNIPSNCYAVAGNRDHPARWGVFACLYPGEPQLHIFSNGLVTNWKLLRLLAAAEFLEPDAAQYAEYIRSKTEEPNAVKELREIAEGLAARDGLPLGCFAVGRTDRGKLKHAVWMSMLLSPTDFLAELKAAARR